MDTSVLVFWAGQVDAIGELDAGDVWHPRMKLTTKQTTSNTYQLQTLNLYIFIHLKYSSNYQV